MTKSNIGLSRIDDHKSHISGRRSLRFLQKIGFQEFQDNYLNGWLKSYKQGVANE